MLCYFNASRINKGRPSLVVANTAGPNRPWPQGSVCVLEFSSGEALRMLKLAHSRLCGPHWDWRKGVAQAVTLQPMPRRTACLLPR